MKPSQMTRLPATLLAAGAVALSAGCAAPPVVVPVAGLEASATVALTDLRPATERESRIFALLPLQPGFGVTRIGEEKLSPPATRLLQHRVFERAGAQPPAAVKVHHLAIYQNTAVASVRTAFATAMGTSTLRAGGEIGGDAARAVNNLVAGARFDALTGDDEWKRGTYRRQENPKDLPAIIVLVETEIDGKRVFTRTLYKTTLHEAGALPNAVSAAIDYHLAQRAQ
ncbi:MAG: hypothetical protein JNL30_18620 [Rubrivivax sp.]|nr:hypothetical protein [Rubrivivax sp.]